MRRKHGLLYATAFVEVRTKGGKVERVVVPPEMFRRIGDGWTVQRDGRLITARSADGRTTLTGASY